MKRDTKSSFEVSRWLSQMANKDDVRDLTPMKLIKLVYLSHGWILGFTDTPLISEPIEAWKYGPVVRNLYHATKQYGNAPIPNDYFDNYADLEVNDKEQDILNGVWDSYKGVSGVRLSTITHSHGSPWYKTWFDLKGSERKYAVIDNLLIRDYYKKLAA